MYDPSQPPLISETLLKKRRSLEDLAFRRSVTLKQQVKRKRVIRGEDVKIKRPEQFVRENKIRQGSENKMKRRRKEAEKKSSATICKSLTKDTVGFIIRIHGARHSSETIKDELRKLSLFRKYDAIFTRMDEERIRQLKALDAYVTYGYLSQKHVVELVHRRAFTNASGTRQPLTDNLTVEKLLGDHGMICLSDLSHEIYKVGPNFDVAISTLSPFKLAAPMGNYEKKVLKEHNVVEDKGGFLDEGAMEEFLNKIL